MMSIGTAGIISCMDTVRTYAEWLKARRHDVGLTQQQLADATGIHRTYILRMEKPGHIDLPGLETRQKVHAALGTTEDELIALGIVRPGVRVPLQTIVLPPREPAQSEDDDFFASLSPLQKQMLRRLLDRADRPRPGDEDAADDAEPRRQAKP